MTITSTNGTSLADRYVAHEAVIERGLATFVEVGEALATIRDDKLYKLDGYKTFEDYCQRRWNLSRMHGHRLVEAAEIVKAIEAENVTHGLHSVPTTERQARALAPLKKEPAKAAKAFTAATKAAGGKQPTAKQVATEVAKVAPPKKAPAKPKPVSHAREVFEHAIKLCPPGTADGRSDLSLIATQILVQLGAPDRIALVLSGITDDPKLFEQIIDATRKVHADHQRMLTALRPTVAAITKSNTNTNTKKATS